MKTAILVSEPEHLALLPAYPEASPWSLSAPNDAALAASGRTFVSARGFRAGIGEAYLAAEEITAALCADPALAPLVYRDIGIAEVLRCSLHAYLRSFAYYSCVMDEILKREQVSKLLVPVRPWGESEFEAMLASQEGAVIAHAARLVGKKHGIEVECIEQGLKPDVAGWGFRIKRSLFGALLCVSNVCMRIGPRPKLKLLASDYWRNIAPIFRELEDAQLTLLDRSEAFKVTWHKLLAHRMQFVHVEQFLTNRAARAATAEASRLATLWPHVRQELSGRTYQSGDLDIGPEIERLLGYIFERVLPRIVRGIEGAYRTYTAVRPDAVLLRATISRQLHFSVLPLVARALGIPSLELQHGTDHVGPGGITKHHLAGCFASYGPLVNRELVSVGFPESRLFAAGSPRFDAYTTAEAHDSGAHTPSVLCVTPPLLPGDRYDTYDLEDYVHALGGTAGVTSDVKLTWRGGSAQADFLRQTAVSALGTRHEIVGMRSLRELFEHNDIVVCHYSTVVYEALMYSKPVVIPALSPIERLMADYHFGPFAAAGALVIAHTPQEMAEAIEQLRSSALRKKLGQAGRTFMEREFLFDGKAARRIADWIRQQAQ